MAKNDPDILVDLTTAATDFEAEVIRAGLEAAGIPAYASTIVGAMNPWDLASTQPMRVKVRRADLDAARRALVTIRREADEIDWSDVDVGAPVDKLAAFGPGPVHRIARKNKRALAQAMIWLAAIRAYGGIALWALLHGAMVRLLGRGKKEQ